MEYHHFEGGALFDYLRNPRNTHHPFLVSTRQRRGENNKFQRFRILKLGKPFNMYHSLKNSYFQRQNGQAFVLSYRREEQETVLHSSNRTCSNERLLHAGIRWEVYPWLELLYWRWKHLHGAMCGAKFWKM